jgi:hypothetical protein
LQFKAIYKASLGAKKCKKFFDIQEYRSCRHFIVGLLALYIAVSCCNFQQIQTDLHSATSFPQYAIWMIFKTPSLKSLPLHRSRQIWRKFWGIYDSYLVLSGLSFLLLSRLSLNEPNTMID